MPKTISRNEKAKIFFEPIEGDKDNDKCKIERCGRIVSVRNPSGRVSHLRSCHSEIYKDAIDPDFLDEKTIQMKRLIFIQNCAEIVSVNGRSFSHLNDSGFQNMIAKQIQELKDNKCGVDLHNFKEVKKYIGDASIQIIEIIKKEVVNHFVALMIDAGSKNRMSILSMNVQYVIDGSIVIRNIGMIRMMERHTARYIKSMVLDRLKVFGIDVMKVIAIASDNAKNFKAAIKLVDENVGRVIEEQAVSEVIQNHQMDDNTEVLFTNTEIQSIVDIYGNDADDVDSDEEDEDLEQILDDNTVFFDAVRSIEMDIRKTTFNVNDVPCSAHTLQLAVKDSFKNSNVELMISLCRIAAKLLRKETYVLELSEKDIQIKMIRLDCKIRWNSTYRMVNIFLQYVDFIDNIHLLIKNFYLASRFDSVF